MIHFNNTFLQALDISDELDNQLGAMCEDDVTNRLDFKAVLEACERQKQKQQQLGSEPPETALHSNNATVIKNLYALVLGSASPVRASFSAMHDFIAMFSFS